MILLIGALTCANLTKALNYKTFIRLTFENTCNKSLKVFNLRVMTEDLVFEKVVFNKLEEYFSVDINCMDALNTTEKCVGCIKNQKYVSGLITNAYPQALFVGTITEPFPTTAVVLMSVVAVLMLVTILTVSYFSTKSRKKEALHKFRRVRIQHSYSMYEEV